jgi:hypothetical protein
MSRVARSHHANSVATAPTLTANGVAGIVFRQHRRLWHSVFGVITESIVSIDPPTSVVATRTSSTSGSLTWSVSSGATSYEVVRTGAVGTTTTVGSIGATFTIDLDGDSRYSYLYKVRSIAPSK